MSTKDDFRIYPIVGRLDFPEADRFVIMWINPTTGRSVGITKYELRPAELRRARQHVEEMRIHTFDELRIPWCAILTGRKARWLWPGRKSGPKVAVTGLKQTPNEPAAAGEQRPDAPLFHLGEIYQAPRPAESARPPESQKKG